ncbi:MAG: hypothetical protein B0D91_03650 [Oceanospirillales bacterium LUC14_002_19_P2]|nr:MAG: hypothetical protein B0D91_03650 [Oceanospirillales bacterium LUC14_002_19_P2]
MEEGLTLNVREMFIAAMAVFNLVLWGPIGWSVRRLVNDYDQHKKIFREFMESQISDLNATKARCQSLQVDLSTMEARSHSLRNDLDDMTTRFHDLRAELPEKYVGIKRYEQQMTQIQGLFQRIMDKLEGKADKQ